MVSLATARSPESLLAALLDVERAHGRIRSERWGPRLLDLDILLWGDRVVDTPGLRIPHPELHRRRFALEPLAELDPGARHPILQKTVAELLVGVRESARAAPRKCPCGAPDDDVRLANLAVLAQDSFAPPPGHPAISGGGRPGEAPAVRRSTVSQPIRCRWPGPSAEPPAAPGAAGQRRVLAAGPSHHSARRGRCPWPGQRVRPGSPGHPSVAPGTTAPPTDDLLEEDGRHAGPQDARQAVRGRGGHRQALLRPWPLGRRA